MSEATLSLFDKAFWQGCEISYTIAAPNRILSLFYYMSYSDKAKIKTIILKVTIPHNFIVKSVLQKCFKKFQKVAGIGEKKMN